MNKLLSFLLLLPVAVQAQLSGLDLSFPAFAYTGAQDSGPPTLNDVDWSKGFESGTVETGLVETDTNSKLDLAATGQVHNGSQSMSVITDADAVIAYVQYDSGAPRSAASICFWHYADTATTDITLDIMAVAASTIGTQNLRCYYRNASGVYSYVIRGTTLPTGITVTTGAWYRIEINYVQNATCTLRVYDSGGTQVGSDQTVTANNNSCQYFYFGAPESSGTTRINTLYWDDIGIDWTDSTYPLWPYSVSN